MILINQLNIKVAIKNDSLRCPITIAQPSQFNCTYFMLRKKISWITTLDNLHVPVMMIGFETCFHTDSSFTNI